MKSKPIAAAQSTSQCGRRKEEKEREGGERRKGNGKRRASLTHIAAATENLKTKPIAAAAAQGREGEGERNEKT